MKNFQYPLGCCMSSIVLIWFVCIVQVDKNIKFGVHIEEESFHSATTQLLDVETTIKKWGSAAAEAAIEPHDPKK